MTKILILLIEDNRMLREGIKSMLKKQNDIRVVDSVSNDENLLQLIGKLKPDVLLLDLGLQNQDSLQLVKLIKKQFPQAKIIVTGLIPLQSAVRDFVQAGVSGFILQDASTIQFVKAIRKVNRGLKVLPPILTGSLFSQIVEHAINVLNPSALAESVRMTKRESQFIELIADGLTNKEIAQKLNLSNYTVKSHVHNILQKLSLSTRVQIAKYAHLSNAYKTAIDTTSLMDE
jgi:DNA-binding NarL/FixJ family response regulator